MTSSDAQNIHERIAAKRAAVAEAKAQRQATYSDVADKLDNLALEAEEARLDNELRRAERSASPEVIAAANESNLTQAMNRLAALSGKPMEPPASRLPANTPEQNQTSTQANHENTAQVATPESAAPAPGQTTDSSAKPAAQTKE